MERSAHPVLPNAEGGAPVPLEVELVRDLSQAAAFQSEWNGLARECDQPYGTTAWMWAWWRHASPRGSRLRTVVVSADSRVIGIAPLFADSRFGIWRYRILGAGVSSRVDLLAAPGRESEVASAVARCLATVAPRPSALIFEGVRDDSPWPRLLAEAWPSVRAPRLYREYSMPAPYLELEAQSFDAWFGFRDCSFPITQRRGLRKLESGGGELRLVSPPGDKARYVSEFARLHYSRWEPHGGSGVLTEGVRKMLLEAALQSDGEGPVELWAIDLPTGTVSVQIVVRTGRQRPVGGIDSALAAMRPGPAILTLTRLIEHAFSSGIGRLDLGAGDQPFKREFAEKGGNARMADPLRLPLAVPGRKDNARVGPNAPHDYPPALAGGQDNGPVTPPDGPAPPDTAAPRQVSVASAGPGRC